MPWISAAAARSTLRQTSRQHLQDQRAGTTPKTVDHMTITDAFIGGEEETMRMAAEHAEAMLPWMETRVPLSNARDIANYLNLTVAARYTGGHANARLEHLLKAKPDKDPATLVLRWIAERVLCGDSRPPRVAKAARWLAAVTQLAPADALDGVLIPEHVDFVDMQAFVLPVALLLETTSKKSFALYARDGGHPERRGQAVYERDATKSAVTARGPDGVRRQGFDAVERKDSNLWAYFYLNQKWDAPIVFQPAIDGMPFLHDLDASWKLVTQSVPAGTWDGIRPALEAGSVTYVIAHDPVRAPIAKGALENASAKYGIKIVAANYMTI
jgi:hypothetical protein